MEAHAVHGWWFWQEVNTELGQWPRLQRYASFVRTFSFGAGNPVYFGCIRKAFFIAASWNVPLFPHLNAVHFRASVGTYGSLELEVLPTLLHNTLVEVTLDLHDLQLERTYVTAALRTLYFRSPNITKLTLRLSPSDVLVDVEAELSSILPLFSQLRTLTIYPSSLLCLIWDACKALPSLHTLRCMSDSPVTPSSSESMAAFQKGSYPSLARLDLSLTAAQARAIFKERHLPSVRECSLRLMNTESAIGVFPGLVNSCRNLKGLTLQVVSEVTTVGYSELCELYSLGRLTSLKLVLDTVLDMSNAELDTLTKSLPFLTELYLAPDPIIIFAKPQTSHITLSVLIPLSQNCAALRSLALFINTDLTSFFNSSPIDTDRKYPRFSSLREINFGLSPVRDSLQVALYLSTLREDDPPSIRSRPSPNRENEAAHPTRRKKFEMCKKNWDKVSEQLDLLRMHNMYMHASPAL